MFNNFRRLNYAENTRPTSAPLRFEVLEDRTVPTTFIVSNLNDAGAGSLRQAVDDANVAAGADVVQFQAGLTGTVGLTSGQLTVTDDLNIQGPGAATLAVSGNNVSRVFVINPGAAADVVSLSGLTIKDGNPGPPGGGVYQLSGVLNVTDCVITGNLGGGGTGGGGILSGSAFLPLNDTTLNLLRTKVTNNRTTDIGGGVSVFGDFNIDDCTISGNTSAGVGSGLSARLGNGETGVIRNSTVSGNENSAAGPLNSAGGMFLYLSNSSSILIENSTISGNSTIGTGGGVYVDINDAASSVTIRNSTITKNIAGSDGSGDGGGVSLRDSNAAGTLTIENSIVAGNTDNGGAPNDLFRDSGILNARFDLIQTSPTGGTINGTNIGNIIGADPMLGPLTNNGGATLTHALLSGSPAINAGDPAFVPPPTTDQRGFPRVAEGRLDMGAVESPTPPAQQPICNPGDSENTCFVKRLYVDLLGRRIDNDDAGLKYIAEIDAGRSRQSVAGEIVHSEEYTARQIRALYQSVLGRDADETGLAGYVAEVTSGHFKLEQVQADLIASDEFRNAHPGDQLIPAILAAIPGGTPDSDANPLLGQDQARDFALDVIASIGAIDANLATTYDELLHRGLDDKAYDYRSSARTSSISAVVADVAASDEYFKETDELTLV